MYSCRPEAGRRRTSLTTLMSEIMICLVVSPGDHGPSVKPGGPKRIVSQLSEGQLVNKVEPVYPHIAAIGGIQGQVKLHAIIGRDGRIQSLNVISGHPLLAACCA